VALRFQGTNADINIQTEIPEFSNWRWVYPDDLSSLAAPFKRNVYESVLNEFKPFLLT
jgi:putative (di)nucleoside polyphosphate hydrolase